MVDQEVSTMYNESYIHTVLYIQHTLSVVEMDLTELVEVCGVGVSIQHHSLH